MACRMFTVGTIDVCDGIRSHRLPGKVREKLENRRPTTWTRRDRLKCDFKLGVNGECVLGTVSDHNQGRSPHQCAAMTRYAHSD